MRQALVAVNPKNHNDIKYINGPFFQIDRIWNLIPDSIKKQRYTFENFMRIKNLDKILEPKYLFYHLNMDSVLGGRDKNSIFVYYQGMELYYISSSIPGWHSNPIINYYNIDSTSLEYLPYYLSGNGKYLAVSFVVKVDRKNPDNMKWFIYKVVDWKRNEFITLKQDY